ncbi:MAG: four helix bundle protein [Patescibacteria group bacterium]|jgi:four helix bundle protein|nr:four helix bundle protein [Patescibacteria group bacterium]
MSKIVKQNFDLEERTMEFAKNVRRFIKLLGKSQSNIEDSKQLIRSSGSIAANYIEANESLSKKDFLMRIKICRKEAKESILWLNLIETDNKNKAKLIAEASELMKIFGSIVTKCQV